MKKRYFVVTFILVAIFALSAFSFVGLYIGNTAYAEPQTLDIYAINDFHGSVDKMPQIAGYLAARKSEGAVIVNSGDMFQGSMESNSNFGKLLADCMDMAGFDAFTYGNHEFDWGLDNLRSLAQNSSTPFLGANIYNWNANTRQWGDFADDLAEPYNIVEANGLKVGIIGVIGKDQITSISSQLVQTIGFKDPSEVVPSISNKLRNEENCDIVIVSAHTGQSTFLEDNSWDISQYANAVLCAHTHQREMDYKGDVPFIQAGSYGNYIAHIQLYVNSNDEVKCGTREYISYNSIGNNDIDSDVFNAVKTKIDNSNASIADEANQVLGTLSGGYLNSQTAVPRLVSQAIAEYATEQGYEIDLAMVNNARNSLQQGNITYTSLYEAIPFDNVVYVAKVSGKDILNEAKYDSNSIWRVNGKAIQNSDSQYYTIAVIDYLLYHQNSYRNYNYFPSAFRSGFTPVALTKSGVEVYNYRLITRDFLLSKQNIDATTYTLTNIYTDKNQLQSTVSLPSAGDDDPGSDTPGTNTPGNNPGNTPGNTPGTNEPGNTPGSNAPSTKPAQPENKLPTYAIVLIAVGAVLVIAVVVVIVVLTLRKRNKNQQ